MDTLALMKNWGGVARTGMLLDTGVTKRQIVAHVRRGELLRLRPGALALPDAPHDFLTAIRNDGFLTCVSAASHYGLWLHTPSPLLHLNCLHARSKDVVNHRSRSVPAHPCLPLVGLVDVLVHALHCLPRDQAAVIVESALRRGDTVRSFLLERLEGPRNGKARATLDRVTGCAESPIEVVARLLFRDAGIRLQTQVPIRGVGRVDFLLEGILIVEVDGDAFHSSRKERTRDRRRDNAALEQGYPSLHFGYEDIMFNQEKVLSQVMAVLARTRRR